MKDNFSEQADLYARYRPEYPDHLLESILSFVSGREKAWDCATGNGQIAKKLAGYFKNVYATDISKNQLSNAPVISNIHYSKEAAEASSFENRFFDLIVVAQAIHWFDFEKFYLEVYRTLKDGGLFAAIGYGLISINKPLDKIIHDLYKNITGPYWDKERKYIDDAYATIPFPFEEVLIPGFYNKFEWDIEILKGYLNTWSATRHYIKANKRNPVEDALPQLREAWGEDTLHTVTFPLFTRIGSKKKGILLP